MEINPRFNLGLIPTDTQGSEKVAWTPRWPMSNAYSLSIIMSNNDVNIGVPLETLGKEWVGIL